MVVKILFEKLLMHLLLIIYFVKLKLKEVNMFENQFSKGLDWVINFFWSSMD